MEHGGNLYKVSEKYGIDSSMIIDFSDNVSPMGVPDSAKNSIIENVSMLAHYPDPDYKSLRGAISAYIDADYRNIVVGNGATELISLFIKVINPDKALLVMPAYSEYERELKHNDSKVNYYVLDKENNYQGNINELTELSCKYDLVVICNPNNPTGTAFDKDKIMYLLSQTIKNNADTVFMIDETYVEFTDDIEGISSVKLTEKYKNVFIIRGLSKFFSVPGLRVGYGVTSNETILNEIYSMKEPWSVSVLSQVAAEALLGDRDYIKRARDFMRQERKFILNELKKIKYLKYYESTCNFFLCESLKDGIDTRYIVDNAIKRFILLRDASNIKFLEDDQFRFCIKLREQNKLLIKYLNDILS